MTSPVLLKAPNLYLVDDEVIVERDGAGRILQMTSSVLRKGLSLTRYLVSYFAVVIRAQAINKCTESYLVIPLHTVTRRSSVIADKSYAYAVNSNVALHQLASKLLKALTTLPNATAATIQRLIHLASSILLSLCSQIKKTQTWSDGLLQILSDHSRTDVFLSGLRDPAVPPAVTEFLCGVLAQSRRAQALDTISEYAERFRRMQRVRFLAATMRLYLPMDVQTGPTLFRCETGGDELEVSDFCRGEDRMQVVVSPGSATSIQVTAFAENPPRFYVVEDGASVFHVGKKLNRFGWTDVMFAPLRELQRLHESLLAAEPIEPDPVPLTPMCEWEH